MLTTFLGPFLLWLRAEGIDVTEMLTRYGLPGDAVGATELEVDHSRYCELLGEAERLAGVHALGLHFAQRAKRAYGPIEALWHNAPDVRTAMRSVPHFNPLGGGRLVFRFDESASAVSLSFSRPGFFVELERVSNEFLVAWFLLQLRLITGRAVLPIEARFAHAAPDDLGPYRALFGDTRLVFEMRESALVCQPEVLDLPILLADPELYPTLVANVRRFGARSSVAPGGVDLSRLRALIRRELPRGKPSAAAIAKALSTSVRSLQRGLRRQETTFADQVDECRRTLALEMLAGSRTLDELRFELGFTTESSFFRAFRRWYGTTPAEYRRRLKSETVDAGTET